MADNTSPLQTARGDGPNHPPDNPGIKNEPPLPEEGEPNAENQSTALIQRIQERVVKVEAEWPELVKGVRMEPLEDDPPLDVLPPVIGQICHEVHEVVRIPLDGVILSALGIAGLAMGGKYHLRLKADVLMRPNLYTLHFLATGERKSTALRILSSPIYRWITEQGKDFRQLEELDQQRQERIQAIRRDLASKKKGKQTDLDSLRQELEELQADPGLPPNPNILADDNTFESLGVKLHECGGRIGVITDECDDFLNILMGKYTASRVQPGLINRCWDGLLPYISGRLTRESFAVENPCMGIVLEAQHHWIGRLAEQEELFQSGHNNRYLTCFSDTMVGRLDARGRPMRAWNELEISDAARNGWNSLITRHLEWSYRMEDIVSVPIMRDAKSLWAEYHDEVEIELGHHGRYGEEVVMAIRYPSHALRVALICALCRTDSCTGFEVDREDVVAGITLVDYFGQHASRILTAMKRKHIPSIPARAIAHIKRHSKLEFSQREIQRIGLDTAEEAETAIQWMVEHGYCRRLPDEPREGPGQPPSPRYTVNPNLFNAA